MAFILLSGILAVLTNTELEQLSDRLWSANTRMYAAVTPSRLIALPGDMAALKAGIAAFAENTELLLEVNGELARRSAAAASAPMRPVPLTPAERARLEDAEYWAGTSDPVAELEQHGAVTPQQRLERECAGYRDGR